MTVYAQRQKKVKVLSRANDVNGGVYLHFYIAQGHITDDAVKVTAGC